MSYALLTPLALMGADEGTGVLEYLYADLDAVFGHSYCQFSLVVQRERAERAIYGSSSPYG